MNSLNINIKEGQKVVMMGDGSEDHRTVTVTGGFGMHTITAGTALFVRFNDGRNGRVDATEIEKLVK